MYVFFSVFEKVKKYVFACNFLKTSPMELKTCAKKSCNRSGSSPKILSKSVVFSKIYDIFRLVHFFSTSRYLLTLRTKSSIHMGVFFLGGGFAGRFEKWSISSLIRVQIAQELVRLITLIGLNKFLIHIISPRPLKKFSWTTFRWSVLRKRTCCWLQSFHKQFYLL